MIWKEPEFLGKNVLITGGSRGIGRAMVELFAAEGGDVTFFYRANEKRALEVVDAGSRSGGKIHAEKVDVSASAACSEAIERLADRCGSIDILVNNAGIIRDNVLGLLDDEDIRAVLDTNVNGVFNVTRAVIPYMISQRSGKVVNISSVSGEKGGRGQTNYAASKGAINAFTRALAVEVASRGITVNAVAPGVIETEMSEEVRNLAGDQVRSRILLRRYGTAEEVAYAVAFLASRYAAYVTGQVLHVDGGFKME